MINRTHHPVRFLIPKVSGLLAPSRSIPESPDRVHSSHRYPALDGLRGLAILMVLSWDLAAELHPRIGTPLAYLQVLARLNWSGVDLFFVLSGFLIGGILIDNREATNYFRAFYMRRICRIFPLYYLCLLGFLLAALCLQGAGPGQRWLFQNQGVRGIGLGEPNRIPLWSYAIYLQNWWMAGTNTWGPGWLGITWSLAVEEQFYLVLPIVLLWIRPKWIGAVSLACIVAAPLFRLATPGLGAYCLLPSRIDALMTGVLIAWLLRLDMIVVFINRRFTYMATGLLVACFGFFGMLIKRPWTSGNLTYSFLALFYGLVLIVAITFPSYWLSRIFHWVWLGAIGRISYGIYLLHMGFVGIAHILIFQKPPEIRTASDAVVSIGAILAAICAAYLSFKFIERRLIAIGHRYKYEKAV
jgi:peptidoglycan/LPS O-acetylase OafA/YrhL